jgi:hypothetical protein
MFPKIMGLKFKISHVGLSSHFYRCPLLEGKESIKDVGAGLFFFGASGG